MATVVVVVIVITLHRRATYTSAVAIVTLYYCACYTVVVVIVSLWSWSPYIIVLLGRGLSLSLLQSGRGLGNCHYHGGSCGHVIVMCAT